MIAIQKSKILGAPVIVATIFANFFTIASAQTPTQWRFPQEQDRLTDIVSKYNTILASLPHGDIADKVRRHEVKSAFYKAFCSALPMGSHVVGWIGEINDITNELTPNGSITLSLQIDTYTSAEVDSIENNYDWIGPLIRIQNWQSESWISDKPTEIAPGTLLYKVVSTLRNGDDVEFSGTVFPFSLHSCIDHTYENTLFPARIQISSIRKVGHDWYESSAP